MILNLESKEINFFEGDERELQWSLGFTKSQSLCKKKKHKRDVAEMYYRSKTGKIALGNKQIVINGI